MFPPLTKLNATELDILRGLFESRVMTARHISGLLFEGRFESAKKCIWKLKALSLIAERQRAPFEAAKLQLTRAGFLELRARGILSEYPSLSASQFAKRGHVSERTLDHELAVLDVKTALSTEIATTRHLAVTEFITWPLLCEFRVRGETQKPDGFLVVKEIDAAGAIVEHRFFLEVDMSTEARRILVDKAQRYHAYCRAANEYGRQSHTRASLPFRVLFVMVSASARDTLAQRLLACFPPILAQAWIASREDVTRDPLGPIWRLPIDLREKNGRAKHRLDAVDHPAPLRRLFDSACSHGSL